MRKTLLVLLAVVSCLLTKAEEILQIEPFTAKAGVIYNEGDEGKSFSLVLNNELTYTAFQLELYLPKGMSLAYYEEEGETMYYYDLNTDRFPTTRVKVGKVYVDIPSHNLGITDKGDGHYHITCYDEDLKTIKGNSGELINFYYETSADIKPGYYPIIIKDVVLGINGNEGTEPLNSSSFVTITESNNDIPVNAILNLEQYYIPSFVETCLPDENVIINGVCNSFVIKDGYDFSAQKIFTAANATYTRPMENEWGTVCLPYAVQSDDNVAYYNIIDVQNGTLTIQKYETLPANTPALMQKVNGDAAVCEAYNVMVGGAMNNVTGEVTMHGSYANNIMVTDANAYYIKNNKFWLNNQYFYIDAFRAYFTLAPSAAKSGCLTIGDIATAIDTLTKGDKVAGVWSTNGIMRNNVEKGMNIIKMADGKCVKVLVK